eukprot:jgi/Bigna1/144376/aug1.87_g19084
MIVPQSVECKMDEKQQKVADINDSKECEDGTMEEMLHRKELEDEKFVNTHQSCCLTSDERALEFFLKSGVMFSVLMFSMIQVVTVGNVAERNAFLNIVILTLGTFLPSPKIKEDEKK